MKALTPERKAGALVLDLLESILPYVRYAKQQGLPNADYYLELIEGLLWHD